MSVSQKGGGGGSSSDTPSCGGSGSGEGSDPPPPNFCSQSISIKAQKKMAGKLASKRAVKFFIDETSARVFDNVFKLVRMYTGSKSRAQKLMKGIIKINIKLAVLYMNDVLSDDEVNLAVDFREKFHAISETCLRIRRPRFRVTVDHLIALFSDCQDIVLRIIANHLSDKSKERVRTSAAFFMNREFLVTIFGNSPEYKEVMDLVVHDIQELMDRGVI